MVLSIRILGQLLGKLLLLSGGAGLLACPAACASIPFRLSDAFFLRPRCKLAGSGPGSHQPGPLDGASRFRLHSGTICCTATTCVPQNVWSIGCPPSSVHPRGLWQQAALLPAPRHISGTPPRPFAWLCISFALSSSLFRRTTWLRWALIADHEAGAGRC